MSHLFEWINSPALHQLEQAEWRLPIFTTYSITVDLLPVFSHRLLLVTSAFGTKQTLRLTASGNFWMPRQRHGGAR